MKNQYPIEYPEYPNYAGRKVLLGASGGINSMAVLCWLAQAPEHTKPAELHLFYAHLEEHSPDTRAFVHAGVKYAQKRFSNVIYRETEASVLELFERKKMIPHPKIAPCTKHLKVAPMFEYMYENQIVDNVVGYVKGEWRRVERMAEKTGSTTRNVVSGGIEVQFPIVHFTDDWCFDIVKREIGWYPAIYDIRDERGRRVFKHNNCLPCKNMTQGQLEDVQLYYPQYMQRAQDLSAKLQRHWGRNADTYYTHFGRPEYETNNGTPCEVCAFD